MGDDLYMEWFTLERRKLSIKDQKHADICKQSNICTNNQKQYVDYLSYGRNFGESDSLNLYIYGMFSDDMKPELWNVQITDVLKISLMIIQ